MWVLSRHANDNCYILLKEGKYSVGRKEINDISINDISVSRQHATLEIVLDSKKQSQLFVKDCSKFGTFVNKTQLKPDEECCLQNGSTLQFGVNEILYFDVSFHSIVLCCSGMKKSRKNDIQALLQKIGGMMTEDCSQCTHLITDEIKLTTRLLLCLLAEKIIVSVSWLEAIEKRTSISESLPSYTLHVPTSVDLPRELSKDLIIKTLIQPKSSRRSLFKDFLFIFLSSPQFKKAGPIIHQSQGVAIDVTGSTNTFNLDDIEQNTRDMLFIVKPPVEAQLENILEDLKEFLSFRHKYCIVDEEEIGMAIIEANLNTYCHWKNENKRYGKRKFEADSLVNQEEKEYPKQNMEKEPIPPPTSTGKKIKPDLTISVTPNAYNSSSHPEYSSLPNFKAFKKGKADSPVPLRSRTIIKCIVAEANHHKREEEWFRSEEELRKKESKKAMAEADFREDLHKRKRSSKS